MRKTVISGPAQFYPLSSDPAVWWNGRRWISFHHRRARRFRPIRGSELLADGVLVDDDAAIPRWQPPTRTMIAEVCTVEGNRPAHSAPRYRRSQLERHACCSKPPRQPGTGYAAGEFLSADVRKAKPVRRSRDQKLPKRANDALACPKKYP